MAISTPLGSSDRIDANTVVKWLMGVIASLISAGCVLWLTTTNAQITELSQREIQHGNEISEIKGQLPHVVQQLNRIEAKVDTVLTNAQKEQRQ
jgi:hypothetical protein